MKVTVASRSLCRWFNPVMFTVLFKKKRQKHLLEPFLLFQSIFFCQEDFLYIKPKGQVTREIKLSNPHYRLDFTLSPLAQI